MPYCYRSLSDLAGSLLRAVFWLLIAPATWAQAPASGAGSTPSVGTILNPDGTVRAGAQGTFSTAGYQLSYGKGGQPVLRAAATGWQALGGGAPGQQNGTGDAVLALAVAGGSVYVGGSFNTAGGVVANHVARWDGTTWSALGTGAANGVNNTVAALAVRGNEVYAGGAFTTAGGTAANYVARWDGTAWSPLGTGAANGVAGQVNSSLGVNALAVASSGDVYVGGSFAQAGGGAASSIARWDGATWHALGGSAAEGVDGTVYSLATSGPSVYVGGAFGYAGGAAGTPTAVAANNMAQWDGSTWSALSNGPANGVDGFVFALAATAAPGPVYTGGYFTTVGGAAANYLAQWNGTSWSPLGTAAPNGSDNTINALAVSGSTLYVGGSFSSAGGVAASYVARWDGSTWSALGTGSANGVGGSVRALALSGSSLYVGGDFTTAGGATASHVARWDGTAWYPLSTSAGEGVDGSVLALAATTTSLYVGGTFATAGGVAASNIARWDGSAWSALGTGTDQTVLALAATNTGVYAGGTFTTAGGATANHIAQWDGTTWSPLADGVNRQVQALALRDNTLYAGGYFTTASSVDVNHIAQWDGSAWSPLGSGTDSPVLALAATSTGVCAGGYFATAGGTTANYVAQWDGSTWSPLGAGPANGVSDPIQALALTGSQVYVGGYFTTAGDVDANRVAYYPVPAAPLPVQLVAFSATAQGAAAVRLAWATASETNSAHFEVERSLDGVAFATRGAVAAAGTSATAHIYGLTDAALPAGATVLYYRLRQVDLDGSASYSPVRSVQVSPNPTSSDELALYPNPASSFTTLLGAPAGGPVRVVDALGRLVLTATAAADGTARLALPANLAAGVYVVRAGQQAVRLTVP